MVIARQAPPSFQKNHEERAAATISRNPSRALIVNALLVFYKIVIYPFLTALAPGRQSCRFYPTCSCYARDCLESLPLYKASFYISKRLLKCSPLYKGQDYFDFAPDVNKQRKSK